MNIVYGGAFNPPTKAHFNIVKTLLAKYENAKIIILPVGNSYNKPSLISFKDRYEMLKLLFKDNSRVLISRLEENKSFDGTISSLEELSKTYHDLHLVIGSDHLETLHEWIRYEDLLNKYPLIIMNRNKVDIDSIMKKYKNYNLKYEKFDFNHPASSTLIRKDLINYKSWLSDDVYKYIIENKLYEVNKDV